MGDVRSDDDPGDVDGDSPRRVAALGPDMPRLIEIDFVVAIPDREVAEALVRSAIEVGYHAELDHDAEEDARDGRCRRTMIPNHEGVMVAQRGLDELSRPLGEWADGWETSGNQDR